MRRWKGSLWASLLYLACVLAGPVTAQQYAFDQSLSVIGQAGRNTPLEVAVAVTIAQIVGVDQKSENAEAVAQVRMTWSDPNLSQINDTKQVTVLETGTFVAHALEQNVLDPVCENDNQQGNRWMQQAKVVLCPDGTARYPDLSKTTLRAPCLNFHRYPFDHQTFTLEITSLFPEEVVTFVADEQLSDLGDFIVEEKWFLGHRRMAQQQFQGLSGLSSSQVSHVLRGDGT